MNAQQLRNSILQEAIEGRLVPQDPNDEPASALLERIREEKRRLVKEGKLKKKDLVETPISEDEKPFEIPESWEWVRFGTITFNRDSERIPLSVDERSKLEKKYDYYGASGVIDKVDKYLFDKPLLLIGEDGANLINRSTPIAFIARGKYWVNNHAHVLDYLNEDLMQYMCWYINAISLVEYVTGTAQPKMNQVKMNSILVPLPPLAEQKRIVAKIEELMPKVEEYGKAQEALDKLNAELPEKLKKSILQEAIEGRLVPQDPNDEPASVLLDKIRKEKAQLVKEGKLKKKDLVETPISEDEKPFDIPESWEWVRIKSIFSMQAGKNVTSADINSEQNDIFKYPCYGGNGLRGYVKGYNTEGTYPLVGRQGALCGNINIASGQFWATEHAVVTDGYGMTPYKWQYYFLVALNLNQYATATAQPGLAVSNIIEVPFPLPPLAEQHRIVARIEELMGKIEMI